MHYQCLDQSSGLLRSKRGSILLLALALGFLIIVLIFFSFKLATFFLSYANNQTVTEATALGTAMVLNENDNAGRMNNLIVQSRELLFDSRAAYHATLDANHFFLEPLARQLLDQSRRGAWSVDQCRKKMIDAQLKKMQTQVLKDEELKRRGAEVVALEVGNVKDLRSNVYDDCADELQEYDKRKSWIDLKTQRFNGNINAKLMNEDEEQNFKLSPLRIPVSGKVEQANLARGEDFVSSTTVVQDGKPNQFFSDQMPSAIKIKLAFPSDTVSLDQQSKVVISATAITTGAQPMP